MNKPKYAKKIFLCFLLIICAGYAPTHSQPTLDAQGVAQQVGRENPFAQIPRASRSITPSALQSAQAIEVAPELFVQTVMLKFLSAKSLQQAITKMSSAYGTISINEKNNSLIICDTK